MTPQVFVNTGIIVKMHRHQAIIHVTSHGSVTHRTLHHLHKDKNKSIPAYEFIEYYGEDDRMFSIECIDAVGCCNLSWMGMIQRLREVNTGSREDDGRLVQMLLLQLEHEGNLVPKKDFHIVPSSPFDSNAQGWLFRVTFTSPQESLIPPHPSKVCDRRLGLL